MPDVMGASMEARYFPRGWGAIYRPGAGWQGVSLPATPAVQLESDNGVWPTLTNAQGLFTDTALTTKAQNTNNVKAFKDFGTNGYHLTNSSGSPTLTASVSTTYFNNAPNGRPYIVYGGSGTQNWLQGATAANWNFMHQGPVSCFIVANPTTTTNGVVFDTGGVSVTPGIYMFWEDSGKTGNLSVVCKGVAGTNGTVNFNNLGPRGTANNAVPHGVWGVMGYDYSGTVGAAGTANLYYNNGIIGTPNVATNAGGASTNAAGAALRLGDDTATGIPFKGGISALIAYNRVVTAAERVQIHQYLCARYGTPSCNIACMGDSIVAGNHIGGAVNNGTWVARAQQRVGELYTLFNFGHSGDKVADTKAAFESTTAVSGITGCNGVWRNGFRCVVISVGVNDLGVSGTSGSATWTALKALFDEVTADSQTYLIGCTVAPFKGNTTFWASTSASDYETLNNSIKAYAPANGNYAFVDQQAIFAGGADAYTMPTGLTVDGLHPNQLGADLQGQAVANAIIAANL